jgi:O-acetylhomoserine (thiol)-lyase
MNPTTDVFERRVAELEGGVAAVATASGQAAQTLTILNLAQAGDSVVASTALYGGTVALFRHTLPRLGITTRFTEPDPESVEAAIDETTRAVYVETIGNPSLDVPKLEALAEVAHRHGVPLVVDNTFATPILCRPMEHGADIVIHSATKWIGGHGTSIGGVVVDGALRLGDRAERFRAHFQDPDPSYHGLRFAETFGRSPSRSAFGWCSFGTWARRFRPSTPSSSCRGWRPCPCAWPGTARTPSGGPLPRGASGGGVGPVPGAPLPSDAWWRRATSKGGSAGCSPSGSGGRGWRPGRDRRHRLFSLLANVGDAKSLVIHPWSTTHEQLTEEERRAAGVTPELIRLSVGIEDVGDLIADLGQALAAAAADGGPVEAEREAARHAAA